MSAGKQWGRVMTKQRWYVSDLATMSFPRQGDLFLWADTYRAVSSSAVCAWARRVADSDQPFPDWSKVADHDERMRQLRANLDWSAEQERDMARTKVSWHEQALIAAARASIYRDIPSWAVLRQLIYERDDGVCWVCGEWVEIEHYECGHLIARLCGGLDIPENLVVMCNVCNRLKPEHDSIEAVTAWRDSLPDGPAWWIPAEAVQAFIEDTKREAEATLQRMVS
jgi:hypothetical protein